MSATVQIKRPTKSMLIATPHIRRGDLPRGADGICKNCGHYLRLNKRSFQNLSGGTITVKEIGEEVLAAPVTVDNGETVGEWSHFTRYYKPHGYPYSTQRCYAPGDKGPKKDYCGCDNPEPRRLNDAGI